MADQKISDFTDGSPLQSTDEFLIARAGANYKIPGSALMSAAASDGWNDDTAETWTYATSTTFTVTGDQTAKYTVGTRIKLTQTTVKYFVVTAVSVTSGTTTVTITGGTDYTLANASITANHHSYAANPQGYPTWFNWTPTYGGFSSSPPSTTAKFRVVGRECLILVSTGNGTSNATTFTVSLPITCDGTDVRYQGAQIADHGSDEVAPGIVWIKPGTPTVATLFKNTYVGWNNAGVKAAYFQIGYPI